MSLNAQQRESVFQYLLMNVRNHPEDIVKVTQEKFSLSRPAILRYVNALADDKKITIEGTTKNRKYTLLAINTFKKVYPITPHLAEDKVWRDDISALLPKLSKNVFDICQYGFSEIFNNALEHSEGKQISVSMSIYPDQIFFSISDDGIGIFTKIQQEYHLDDPLHAILELSKGKLTTDSESHTGEGIFFTSKMFDVFAIHSHKLKFASGKGIEYVTDSEEETTGTSVYMQISLISERTTQSIFSKFTDEDFGFTKTVVPVSLARYGNENLISRSQARRLLARLEKFKSVVLDFENVQSIGRAFADEIFRVFQKSHPDTKIIPANANPEITRLIDAVK
jgi:anti-sigma regulatory factor (Ser/Thr protein kinase)